MASNYGTDDTSDEGGVTDSPKKGPTLSTSTSSFEALDPHDPNLSRLANNMFEKSADYILGELTICQEDYKLLESMNRATEAKYTDMKLTAKQIADDTAQLNQQYSSLKPYLDQIEAMSASVTKLEQAAYKLDAYSKRLEAKFKALEKR